MIVTVIGKTPGAKPGIKLFVAHKSWGVDGFAVSEFWVNPNICLPDDIIIGRQYEICSAKSKYVFKCDRIIEEHPSDIFPMENIDDDYLNSLVESEPSDSQPELVDRNARKLQ